MVVRLRVLVGTVLASLGLALAPAGAGAATYRSQLLHFVVHVGPGRRTACRVVGELVRPTSATAAHPVPAVLTTNGFGGSYTGQLALARSLAGAGYAVLSYSGLGFGGSSCRITMDSPQWDGQAASQLITFLGGGSAATNGTRVDYVIHDRTAHNGRHYRYDPRVAMIGASYGGEAQFAAAAIDPRLDAIVPIITWNNLQYSLAPNDANLIGNTLDSATPGITKQQWLGDFVLVGENGPRANPSGGPSSCPNFAQANCAVISQLISQGYPDAATAQLANSYSVSSYVHRIRIPVMLMQGEDDTLFNLNESVATYDALRAQRTPVKLVWQSWGHSNLTWARGELGPGLSLRNPGGSLSVEGRMIKLWFDHYLKRSGPAPALNFSFFRPWVGYSGYDAAAAYASAPRYPLGTTTSMYLSGTSAAGNGIPAGAASLALSAAGASAAQLSFTTPAAGAAQSVTEQSGINQSMPLSDPAGSFAEFVSAPLAVTTDVVGIPSVTFTVTPPPTQLASPFLPGDVGLFVKLEDISPGGSVTLPDRLLAPARFPDNGAPVTVTLPGIVHRFAAGDRIALVIAGSDQAYFQPYDSLPVTISSPAGSPGVLSLPVAGRGSYTPVRYTQR